MKRIHLRHLLLALLLLTTRLGWSQGATTAAMSGTITDSKGGPLPGATVVAVHTPTNTTYGAGTNADGRFNIQGMRVGGPYTVKITFVGYQDVNRSGLSLTLAENFRLDAKLSDANTALGEVVVTGRQNPVINADRTGAATTVQREQIERLPTISRSFDDITRLTPQASGQSFGGRNNLYNNITIDGAIFNNSFGLSGTVGGQAAAQPISLDAIDQIQVSLAPYDVRQGSFTGAGINAVTRSGSNKVTGSLYSFYRDQALVSSKVGKLDQDFGVFNLKNYGFRVGGPIVKDKLFFFLNGEEETRTDPSSTFAASRAGASTGTGVSQASGRDLDNLSTFLQTNYGYNAGPFENFSRRTFSRKATAKLDWNINNSNRFSFKYNYLRSYQDVAPSTSGALANGRNPSQFGLPFFSSYYTINNNLDSYIAELNSTVGNRFANNLTAGYLRGRDFRTSVGGNPFPLVDIGTATTRTATGGNIGAAGSGVNQLTSFGYEPFTANNVLDTDTYQFGDNFTAYLGKHNVTVGTYSELYKFSNGFAPNYFGAYQFNGLADFYAAARTTASPNGYAFDPTTGAVTPAGAGVALGQPQRYQLQYSAAPGGAFPFAETRAAQVGVYVQDEYSPIPNLKVTVGLRGDLPIIFSDIARNTTAANLTFRDGQRIETDLVPERKVLFSPRVGFNWDVNDDKKTQLRGGTGIFTGRIPFVWLSNQAGNNGVLFGSFDRNAGQVISAGNAFSPSVDTYRPEGAAANASYNLAITARNFQFPQVFRSNLAVDQELPGGIVATIEALYTKDLNAVYFQNINLPQSTLRASGADNRPIFYRFDNVNPASGLYTPGTFTAAGQAVSSAFVNNRLYNGPNGNGTGATLASPVITDAILLNNTNRGYQYSVTGQLQKSFRNGLFAQVAYTYSDARSVNDGGSIAQSSWRDRQISGDPNAEALSYSQYFAQHRVVGALSYRATYLGHLSTTVSAFYQAAPAGRFSYVYTGDVNGDNAGGNNDLLYVPRNQGEIQLRDQTLLGAPAGQAGQAFVYTAAQQWNDLNTYIEQDEYLSKRRGEYAERNGAQAQWLRQLDVRLLQDIFTNVGNNRNTLQLSLDAFNIGNLISSDWGTVRQVNRANLLAFQGYDVQGRPNFTYPYLTAPSRVVNSDNTVTVTPGVPLTTTFRDNTGLGSRWQMQIGLRYIFN